MLLVGLLGLPQKWLLLHPVVLRHRRSLTGDMGEITGRADLLAQYFLPRNRVRRRPLHATPLLMLVLTIIGSSHLILLSMHPIVTPVAHNGEVQSTRARKLLWNLSLLLLICFTRFTFLAPRSHFSGYILEMLTV